MQISTACLHRLDITLPMPLPLPANQARARFAGGYAPLCIALAVALSACGSAPRVTPVAERPISSPAASNSKPERNLPVLPPANSGRGGYYQDDGPGESPPAGLYDVPDAEPKVEALAKTGNKSYVVFGKTYTPLTDERPFVQRGVGSWYGKKFHGQRTSSGEPYDMYKMTAAHPLLPIPSFARVTNLINGKQVIVRVNDRGPFHAGRVIDLSYTAALKLGLLGKGSHEVEIERLLPDEIARINARRQSEPQLASASTSAVVRAANASLPPLALSSRDARKIRELDQALRSERILPAPSETSIDSVLATNAAGHADGAQQRSDSMHFEQKMAQVQTMPIALPVVTASVNPVTPGTLVMHAASTPTSTAASLGGTMPSDAAQGGDGNGRAPAASSTDNLLPEAGQAVSSAAAAVSGASSTFAAATEGRNAPGSAYYLQLGAFSLLDNAQAERAKLAQTALPSLEVVQAGGVFRLYSGPFSSRAEAQSAAVLVRSSKVLVVQR